MRVRDALDLRATTTPSGWYCWRCNTSDGRSSRPSKGQRRTFEQAIAGDWRRPADHGRFDQNRRGARFLAQFPAALKQAARVSIKALGFNGPVVLRWPGGGVALALASLSGGRRGLAETRAGRTVRLRTRDTDG